MKKNRYLLLSLLGFFCVTSLQAQNSTVTIDGLKYSIPSEGDATLTGGTIPNDGKLVIPETITYENRVIKVAHVAAEAFEYNHQLKFVDFGNVQTIGSRAFLDCTSLDSLCFVKVDTIGSDAFCMYNSGYDGSSLRSIDFGNVKSIGAGAFQFCKKLTSLNFKNVQTIGHRAFYDCDGLRYLDFAKVDSIGYQAFRDCDYLNKVKIGAKLAEFDVNGIFYYNSRGFTLYKPTGSTLSSSWSDYSNKVFDYEIYSDNYFYKLLPESASSVSLMYEFHPLSDTHIVIPSTVSENGKDYKVTAIANRAFQGKPITSVDFGNVECIGDSAFYQCVQLDSLDFKNVRTIGSRAFYNCTSLDSLCFSKVDTIGSEAFSVDYNNYKRSALKSLDFGNVKSIGEGAFKYCHHLSNLDFKNVQIIGSDAFNSCDSLKTLDFKNVQTIGNHAFYDCSQLVALDFKNVETIGSYAFALNSNYRENSLSSISLGKVKNIGEYAFAFSRKLASLDFLHVDSIGNSAFAHCDAVSKIDFRNVKYIGQNAFYACRKIKTFELDYIEYIGLGAFNDCDNIQKIKIDLKKAPEIEYNTFSSNFNLYVPAGCKDVYKEAGWSGSNYNSFRANIIEYDFQHQGYYYHISSVPESTVSLLTYFTPISKDFVVPEKVNYIDRDFNVTELGDYAFASCDSLTSIDFKQVETVGASAFRGCSKLTALDFKNIKTIGSYAFADCDSLTSLDFKNVSSIGTSAFSDCNNIQSVDFKNLKSIGDKAFLNCRGLIHLDFQNVENIGSSAFEHCHFLEAVDFKDVKNVDYDAFSNCPSLNRIKINEILAAGKVDYFDNYQDLIVYKPSQSFMSSSWSHNDIVSRVIDYDFATPDYLYKLEPDGVASVSGELFILHKDVVIPEKVNYQGQVLAVRSIEDGAFDIRRNLKSVDLNDIRKIGNYSFANCDSLKIVNMENVEYINNNAFKNTHRIETINSGATVPPVIADKSVFEHAVYINSQVFVPVGCKGAYLNDSIWSNFFSIGESSDITISQFALTVESNIGGSVHLMDSLLQQQRYEAFVKNGEEIVVTLTPDECFVLDSIRVNGKDVFEDVVDNVYTFTMSKNIDLEVVFKREALHIDDAKDSYSDASDVVLKELTYTRYFEDVEWQPLYIPFVMNYKDWADHFDVARLNNVHQYDTDNDGIFERTELEVVRVNSGKIEPNIPYLIRAKASGSYTFNLSDVELKAAKVVSVDCSSLCHFYTFTGTYEAIPDDVLYQNNLYTVTDGELSNGKQNSLGAFRWYLSVTNRGEQKFASSRIRIVEVDEVTGIEENHMIPSLFKVYDVEGRLVKDNATDTQGLQTGIYIINGQKVMVK